ncbi:MAG: biopolymer transporter ExbD [Prevotella sp.]|mgnify:FL=1|nr:biopolymer transporter ExbD [Bacteroidales bacterium]MDD6509686.1 biopolymer transporter ExbD [Prevotella sp.]MDY3842663.1 biopolymer transporter ExbD [Prevotella sp.]
MGKVKIKKNDVWIDMTPMSDVMVLLLTFFMLTSTFVKNDPVKVTTPGSVSEIKVPEKDVLFVHVAKDGKVFLTIDNANDLMSVASAMAEKFGVDLTPNQREALKKHSMLGVSMDKLAAYLSLPEESMTEAIQKEGIPTDSIDDGTGKKGKSEFQQWITEAVNVNEDMKIAIKADQDTPYKVVKTVMSELQDMSQNRYYLITSFKTGED